MAEPIKKPTAPGPVRHKVLYMRGNGKADFFPLASREASDPTADDDFQVIKLEHLGQALRAGAVRPEFKVVIEVEGKEVE